MKLLPLIFPLILLLLSTPRATSQMSSNLIHVDSLIRDDLNKNMMIIRERSQHLTDTERLLLLQVHEKSSISYALLNMFTGPFGIGSMIQGDPLGFAVLGLTASTLVISAAVDDAGLMFGISSAVWITSWFLPSIYSSRYTSKLQKALNLRGISCLSLMPRIDLLANGTPSVGITLGVGF